MKPRKKGQQYEISYRCPGYSKPFYERFSSYEEANLRIAQIEYEKSLGVFQPPKPVPIPIRSTRQKYICAALGYKVQFLPDSHGTDNLSYIGFCHAPL